MSAPVTASRSLDHMSFTVSNLARARAFYGAALAPLGISVQMELPAGAVAPVAMLAFGRDGKPELWLVEGGKTEPRLHLAFAAVTRAEVDAFYKAAIAAGGIDNGAPGLRPHYHADYYGAFVLDADGHNVEAVCHAPQ